MPLHYLKLSTEIDFNKASTAKVRTTASRAEPGILRGMESTQHLLVGTVNLQKKGVGLKAVVILVLWTCSNKNMKTMNRHNPLWQLLCKGKKLNRSPNGPEPLPLLELIHSN
jgi:hypothetical protein